jgi:hypothetical protein
MARRASHGICPFSSNFLMERSVAKVCLKSWPKVLPFRLPTRLHARMNIVPTHIRKICKSECHQCTLHWTRTYWAPNIYSDGLSLSPQPSPSPHDTAVPPQTCFWLALSLPCPRGPSLPAPPPSSLVLISEVHTGLCAQCYAERQTDLPLLSIDMLGDRRGGSVFKEKDLSLPLNVGVTGNRGPDQHEQLRHCLNPSPSLVP